MDACVFTGFLQAKETDDGIADDSHERNEGAEESGKQVERARDEEHGSFRALQGNGFGNQLSQDNMSSGNQRKADDDGKTTGQHLGGGSANPGKERLDQMRQGWLSNPPQGQTGQGDAQLGGCNVRVQMRKLRLHELRRLVAFLGHLLDTGGASFDQGKLASNEEA